MLRNVKILTLASNSMSFNYEIWWRFFCIQWKSILVLCPRQFLANKSATQRGYKLTSEPTLKN